MGGPDVALRVLEQAIQWSRHARAGPGGAVEFRETAVLTMR